MFMNTGGQDIPRAHDGGKEVDLSILIVIGIWRNRMKWTDNYARNEHWGGKELGQIFML